MNPLEIFIFTKVASTETLILILMMIVFVLFMRGSKRKSLTLLISTIGMMSSVVIAKNYFQIERPAQALVQLTSYALPSGHAAGAFFLAVVVMDLIWNLNYRYRQAIILLPVFLAVIIGYSRIMLQVHTWFQVFAGACLGLFFGFLYIYFSNKRK
jgi:undecaprenyl-diphosphatase